MSRDYRPPSRTEKWFSDGKPTGQAFEFFGSVERNNAILEQGATLYKRYADLAEVIAFYPTPNDGLTVLINDIGLATYKASIEAWVLSSDDITEVT